MTLSTKVEMSTLIAAPIRTWEGSYGWHRAPSFEFQVKRIIYGALDVRATVFEDQLVLKRSQ
jgi:hypothetical protein